MRKIVNVNSIETSRPTIKHLLWNPLQILLICSRQQSNFQCQLHLHECENLRNCAMCSKLFLPLTRQDKMLEKSQPRTFWWFTLIFLRLRDQLKIFHVPTFSDTYFGLLIKNIKSIILCRFSFSSFKIRFRHNRTLLVVLSV